MRIPLPIGKQRYSRSTGLRLKDTGGWCASAYTPIAAKTVKDSLVELGCRAGSNEDTGRNVVYVYAYLMSDITKQGDEDEELFRLSTTASPKSLNHINQRAVSISRAAISSVFIGISNLISVRCWVREGL